MCQIFICSEICCCIFMKIKTCYKSHNRCNTCCSCCIGKKCCLCFFTQFSICKYICTRFIDTYCKVVTICYKFFIYSLRFTADLCCQFRYRCNSNFRLCSYFDGVSICCISTHCESLCVACIIHQIGLIYCKGTRITVFLCQLSICKLVVTVQSNSHCIRAFSRICCNCYWNRY